MLEQNKGSWGAVVCLPQGPPSIFQKGPFAHEISKDVGFDVLHDGDALARRFERGRQAIAGGFRDKIIHPFSDFLPHDIGTGDGIVQNGPPATRNKPRTAPLWGLRTRNQFMHDGQSLTLNGAILRHGGEASASVSSYRRLSDARRARLITFLRSL